MLNVVRNIRPLRDKISTPGHLPQPRLKLIPLPLSRKVSTDDKISFDPSDPRKILQEIAKRASRYSINLDGLVSQDHLSCFRGGCAYVSSGILQLSDEVVIRGTASSGLIRDGKTMKVSLLLNHNFAIL